MAILAPTLSNKVQKALEGLSETRVAFQGFTDSLSEDKLQDWKRQEKQASRQRGMLSRSMKSNKKRSFESLIGSHDLDADPPMQCHHRLT